MHLAQAFLSSAAMLTCCSWNSILAKLYATQMSPRLVETQYGKIRGVQITLPNRSLGPVEAFFGLQYASVLNGDLRFMPPTGPTETWEGIRVALRFRPVCPQKIPDLEELEQKVPLSRLNYFKRLIPFLEPQQEECLNLNIYLPLRAKNDTELLPVVVFIHGESYESGTGNAYDGSVLAAYGHVMVITLNYRLGVLGFLSTDDSNASGNYALLDQVAALHWIKENIKVFGGNPNDVTLLGQGYGGALVNLLLISPVTKGKGLFKKAIIHSGSALSSWAITEDPLPYARLFAEKVNCSEHWGESARLLQCFKQTSLEDIVRVDIKAPKYFSAFGPTIDRRSFLTTDVRSLMDANSDALFASTPLLLGCTKNEGLLYFSQQDLDEGIPDVRMRRILRTFVQNVYSYHQQKLYDIIAYHYSDWERPRDQHVTRDNMIELLGDSQYVAPTVELARYHSVFPVATYIFTFGHPTRPETHTHWTGNMHGDDLIYVFGAPLTDGGIDPFGSSYTRTEKLLAETVLRYWTNFIKTGNPNEPTAVDEATRGSGNRIASAYWPMYNIDSQEYMIFDRKPQDKNDGASRPIVRHHYRGAKMGLWLDLIPKIHRADNLERRFHLLDNYDNRTTFEEQGTKELQPKLPLEPVAHRPSEPVTTQDDSPPRLLTATTGQAYTSAGTTQSSTPSQSSKSNSPPQSLVVPTRRPLPVSTASPRRSTTTTPPAPKTRAVNSLVATVRDVNLPLSATIAVGCGLLLLNLFIFACMYRQKRKTKKHLVAIQKRETMQHKNTESGMMNPNGSGDVKSCSLGPESESNHSSLSSFSARLAAEEMRQQQMQQLQQQQQQQQRMVHFGASTLAVKSSPRAAIVASAAPSTSTVTGNASTIDGYYATVPSRRAPPVRQGALMLQETSFPEDSTNDARMLKQTTTLTESFNRNNHVTANHGGNPSTTV